MELSVPRRIGQAVLSFCALLLIVVMPLVGSASLNNSPVVPLVGDTITVTSSLG